MRPAAVYDEAPTMLFWKKPPAVRVRFLTRGRRATLHPDEPQFHHQAGEVIDLARVTRSPDILAAELLELGRVEAVGRRTR